ncbi:MAG: OmpA family protein [Deltaproteobacteria bacterium]|nr:OmpA family protein [Deltaproteobacteria bacterium]
MRILFVIAMGSVFLSGSCVTKSKYTTQVEKYKQLKMNYSSLEQEKEGIRKKLDLKTAELKRLLKQYNEVTASIKTVKSKLKGAKGLAGELENKLKATKLELEELRKAREEAEERAQTLKKLTEQFKSLIKAGNLEVINRNGRLIIKLKAAVLFSPGQVKVKSEGKKALKDIAVFLARIKGKHFQVAGHTDNDPIKKSRYKDNWLLSSYRAVNVVRTLEEAGVPGKMLSAAGYSEYQQLKPNDSDENKKFNRRIEIQIIPEIPSFMQ